MAFSRHSFTPDAKVSVRKSVLMKALDNADFACNRFGIHLSEVDFDPAGIHQMASINQSRRLVQQALLKIRNDLKPRLPRMLPRMLWHTLQVRSIKGTGYPSMYKFAFSAGRLSRRPIHPLYPQ